MFGRTTTDNVAEKAKDATSLAADLAQDKKFRRELLAAVRNGAMARERTRRATGTVATMARLAADEDLRKELRRMGENVQRAWGRVEKKRSHKLRNTLLLASGASAVAATPPARQWLKEHAGAATGGARVITDSIDVDVPVRTAYNQWTQFEEFPRFMEGVESVQQLDDTRLHWVAIVGGKRAEWDAKILEQHPDRQISWISDDGKTNRGTVSFEELAPARTRIQLSMSYRTEGVLEALGSAVGFDSRRVRSDLDRFKRLIEERSTETGAWRGEINAGQAT